MRILFISRRYFPAISGMSVYAQNLLRELAKLGHDLSMISQFRGDEAGTRVYGGGPPPPLDDVKIIGLEALGEQESPACWERDIETMVETGLREHEKQPFDLVHAQYGYPTGLAALEFSRRTGIPNVVSIQGGDGHWVGPCCQTHREAMQIVLGHAGALLIGSRSFAGEVEENHGVSPDVFTIVPGAVNCARFSPRADWKAGQFQNPDEPVFLYHGRVDRRKGALDTLEALAILAQKGRRFRLIVSGIGPDYDAVRDRVRELHLSRRTEILGYVHYDDVPEIYRRGDVFLSPTYAEGFSNTILEAMASGLPCVSCFAVGVVDCLRDGENGLLVQPGDISALAAAIERLCDDASLRSQITETAFEEANSLYSWPTIARQIAGIYESLRGTAPDLDWNSDLPVDLSCRFREAPHLL
ncbi:MAG TPA: glycosyltransferase family 4 protein [Abditibacterium sp.]|jgi:glycosyltransferase involved in cell wall biosynthesis